MSDSLDSSVQDGLDLSYDHLSDETSDQNLSSFYEDDEPEQPEEKETVEFAEEEERQILLEEIYALAYEKKKDLSRSIYLMKELQSDLATSAKRQLVSMFILVQDLSGLSDVDMDAVEKKVDEYVY